jgi:Uma2 family endonuclease
MASMAETALKPTVHRFTVAGIPESWLVALPEETLYVYREPSPDCYREIRIFRRGGTIAPLGFPDVALAVSDLLG